MQTAWRSEKGQTVVEFGIIAAILLILTMGLVDVGRAFFQYNAVAAAARYGARWGSVVGGTCSHRSLSVSNSTSDWCNQLGTGSGPVTNPFWTQAGNKPVWGDATTRCPTTYSGADSTNSYLASNYTGSSSTTVVGAIVHRFDSSGSSTNLIVGNLTPGIDLSKTRICVELSAASWDPSTSTWRALPGDIITVYVYYRFFPVGALVPGGNLDLIASGQYQVEGS
jgi:TadE-like protein